MNFDGDLSKYHPADAIMFLSQLGLSGILSITKDRRLITLSFDNGYIVDAHSPAGDAKILRGLIHSGRISSGQAEQIRQIQSETAMPIRSILAQLDLFPMATVVDILQTGVQEAMLELFLLDEGAFHFSDTPMETDASAIKIDAGKLAIHIAAQSDEYRDFLREIISIDRQYTFTPQTDAGGEQSKEEALVLRLLSSCRTVGQVLNRAPCASGSVIAVLKEQMGKGAIAFLSDDAEKPQAPPATGTDPLFRPFRQALKSLMLADNSLKRIESLVAFGTIFYDHVLILTSKAGRVIHCKARCSSNGRAARWETVKGPLAALADEPVLAAVHRSGVGFFGNRFPSALIDKLCGQSSAGECALIPVINKGAVTVFFYALSTEGFSGLSPQHYLELLSWMVTSPTTSVVDPMPQPAIPARPEPAPPPPRTKASDPQHWVNKIGELPPLPALVTRALDMLSDPGVDFADVENVIGKDQSLVSKLIKISNSALYAGRQRVESLQQAMARLGAKTTRSLVLSASMQSYFTRGKPGMKTWGRFLWQHAAECGMAARRIALATQDDDPEKAFVGGVVHDIGKLVLLLIDPDVYRQIQNLKKRKSLPDHEAEQAIVGTDHGAIGEVLMNQWKMPDSATACVRFHHRVDAAGDARHLAAITAYANHLSHQHGAQFHWAMSDPQGRADRLADALGLSESANTALVESVIADFQQTDLL